MLSTITNYIKSLFVANPIITSNHNKPWSDSDIAYVAVNCTGSHESIAECAISLGRTESAIRTLYYKCRKDPHDRTDGAKKHN